MSDLGPALQQVVDAARRITDKAITCCMPVMRAVYDDETDSFNVEMDACGEEIFVVHEEGHVLFGSEPMYTTGPTWSVRCALGHVLLVPAHGGCDDFDRIPFVFEQAMAVIKNRYRLAMDGVTEGGG